MKHTIAVYIHGRGGSPAEAKHYETLFPSADLFGLAFTDTVPWVAGSEIHHAIAPLRQKYDRLILIANSIGAYYAMHAGIDAFVSHAFFISPVVDMEGLIKGMMKNAGVSEEQLKKEGVIHTDNKEELSWEYLCYARENPIVWKVKTDILYGASDLLTSRETISAFAEKHHATLTVMEEGEHWFHTDAQMRFLDDWIREIAEL